MINTSNVFKHSIFQTVKDHIPRSAICNTTVFAVSNNINSIQVVFLFT